jgi:twitching motility protein PilI
MNHQLSTIVREQSAPTPPINYQLSTMNHQLSTSNNKQQNQLGPPYLSLQIEAQTRIALPMQSTQEVLRVPSLRITPIPNLNPAIIGLLNQRSRIFFVVDLALILGLQSNLKSQREYNIAIIRDGKNSLGLAVPEIKGMTRISEDKIKSPIGTISPNLIPYLRGCIFDSNNLVLILEPSAIMNYELYSEPKCK